LPLYLAGTAFPGHPQPYRPHGHHTTLTAFLQHQPNNSLDAYLFLDAQDWMDQAS
jgi:S-adenosylmethionine-diacylglycerol 3-amino-3-carboxypropyl transferase